MNEALRTALAEAAGVTDARRLHLVQVGSSGATGAVAVHAWVAGEDRPCVVAKTLRDPRAGCTRLEREWQSVCALREHEMLAACVPAALARFTSGGAEYFVYEGAPGRTMYSRYRNRMLRSRRVLLGAFAAQALEPLARVHATASRPATGETLASDLRRDLDWLEAHLPGFPRSVGERARGMAERLVRSRGTLPLGRVHGDFSPYNVLTTGTRTGARVTVVDWEHAEPERPQYLDVFRFLAACALMGLRGGHRRAVFEGLPQRDPVLQRTMLRPWLARMGVVDPGFWLEPASLEALWWHYYVHAARREQERLAEPADWQDSTYVPALAQIAAPARAVPLTVAAKKTADAR